VDDLFQEAMLVAWRRLHEYDRARPFGPWLRGIAARLVMAHARKAKRDVMVCDQTVVEYLDQQIQRISQRSGDCWDEKVAALRECLAALPDLPKQVIFLRYMDGHTVEGIAGLLDVKREAIKKRLQRARGLLLDCLQRKGVLLEPGP
jgi:RNA polymerase sigma-70 factor (ECF subfamily)